MKPGVPTLAPGVLGCVGDKDEVQRSVWPVLPTNRSQSSFLPRTATGLQSQRASKQSNKAATTANPQLSPRQHPELALGPEPPADTASRYSYTHFIRGEGGSEGGRGADRPPGARKAAFGFGDLPGKLGVA